RSLEQRGAQLSFTVPDPVDVPSLLARSRVGSTERLALVQQALLGGAGIEEAFEATGIDPWYLDQLSLINEVAEQIRTAGALTEDILRLAKRHGFSDGQIGELT